VDRGGRKRKRRIKGTGKREFVIETLLRQRGFEVFLPTKKVWRRKSKYTKEKRLVSYPLLVGWVFVGWPMNQYRWGDLFRVNLVNDVAAVDGVPFMIPQSIMDDMFKRWGGPRTQAPERERFMRTHYEFNVGDKARVVEGPFDGQIIRVVDLRGAKAKVLLDFLGGEREIEIDTQLLEVA
jgi:transcription antitermination factor NusG